MKTAEIERLESERLALQDRLDSAKTQAERNRMGQFATPTALAVEILRYAQSLLPHGEEVRFIDPAFGTGAFYSAMLKAFSAERIVNPTGFEIDPHYAKPAARLWSSTELSIKNADFTRQEPKPRFNLLICNPPYVRHHHMDADEKIRLQSRTQQASGTRIGGLAGLYCYFIGLSHAWLAPNAVSIWLVPSEFMDVNYGQAVKRYLLERVTLLNIHRFDPSDVQFADALVSSAIVCFRNTPPPNDHKVTFTLGGSFAQPKLSKVIPASALVHETKWTRFPAAAVRSRSDVPTLADFFKIKRGVATGDNSYFILSAEELESRRLPRECFIPILPSPRYVPVDEVKADASGAPLLDRRLFLLNAKIPESEIEWRYPSLFAYLQEGKERGLHERYLCQHRSPWYAQEERPPAPIVCTYLGRGDKKNGRPFRFVLNLSQATVANVWLAMYPTPVFNRALASEPELIRKMWELINCIAPEQLLGEGRVYGGGLHKLEPRELANVPLPDVDALFPKPTRPPSQAELFA